MENSAVPFVLRDHSADLSIVNEVMSTDVYSPDLIDYSLLRSVIDAGAHIGSFSRYVKLNAPGARIVAIEPDFGNAELFLRNLNGYGDVTLVVARLAYRWLDVVKVRHDTNTGATGFIERTSAVLHQLEPGMMTDETDATAMVQLEQFVRGPVDLLKMDIEGAEFDVFWNVDLATLSKIHWIVGEYHGASGDIDAAFAHLAPAFVVRRSRDTGKRMGNFCLERRADA